MKTRYSKPAYFIISVIIIIIVSSNLAIASWLTLLDENFNKDQQNENLEWPWLTDLRVDPPLGWHWNPEDPHPRAEGDERSNYCWGLQDYIFNRHVTPEDEIRQALWCAVTNRSNTDRPRYPADDDYMNDQNAWVWWGPADLSDAEAAGISFWMYLDLANYARDSLSVIATTVNPRFLTDEDFFDEVPVARSFARSIGNDWIHQVVYLDSLVLAGDEDELVSVLGEEEVWIGFVWHSDANEITGKGAFIDDVTFSWDDGLFDIYPVDIQYGYPVNVDTTYWTDRSPEFEEEVGFRLNFKVLGIGETPEFTINMYLDDEIFYTENVIIEGDDGETFTITTDALWQATPDSHFVRWELDTPIEENGNVEESFEDNNLIEIGFFVEFNTPPHFEITAPVGFTELDMENPGLVGWTIEDSLGDEEFRILLFYTPDTSGLLENNELVDDYYLFNIAQTGPGEGSFEWPTGGRSGYAEVIDRDGGWIVGIAGDGHPGNYVLAISPGKFVGPEAVTPESSLNKPDSFGLNEVFPNPFNNSVDISYSLETTGSIKLSIIDLSGRELSILSNEYLLKGEYRYSWQPWNFSSGVYFVKLQSENKTSLRKIVYLP